MFDHKHVYVSVLKHKCLKVKHVSVSCFYSVIFTKLDTFDSLLISGESRYLAVRLFNFVHSYKK